ncbi:MAG: pilus assembly protein N-terminal domain-containing protein [Xanthobacteraceae bacterium]|nr:pilus assembly protein N-terminal domain-containing protein [Xanthobacteraceae bacterium]MBV9627516.1 pilus assembly protein N-terminal domain-containing protein [Xanthobacteraceae bacterium]
MTVWLRAWMLGLIFCLVALSTNRASDETLEIALGTGHLLTLDRAFETVLIDAPEVIDVSPQTSRTVLLKALNRGISNVVFVDEQSIAITNIRVVVREARV